MKRILIAHYEKIILAVLLIVFAALLYYQVQVVQQVQNKEVDIKVNPVPKPSDYEPVDFAGDKKYRMENIFSDRLVIDLSADRAQNVTEMMAPYPLSECVYCHTLIPASCYPAVDSGKTGKCPACNKTLAAREKVDENELLGKADLNGNTIPDEWEKQFKLTDYKQDSDEDSDGFTLIQEYKAKTDPLDPKSHPKYLSMLYVSAIRRARITGLELVSVNTTKPDKKDWEASFKVVRNGSTRTEFVRINDKTFKNNNVDYSVIDIEMDEKTQEPIVYLQRVGKVERIVCNPKQAVYDPLPRVTFNNTLYSNRTFNVPVGSNFKLGTAKTGEELYKVVSADADTKSAVVETVDVEPAQSITVPAMPKDAAAARTTGGAAGAADDNSFLNPIK